MGVALINRGSIRRARLLRRNMTIAERRLWSRLRLYQVQGYRFRRQEAVGPYVVDFDCRTRRLVVEVDGGQHAEASAGEIKRTKYLEDRGYRILRVWNHDVLANTEGVVAKILEAL